MTSTAFRLFRCQSCGHKMRATSDHCGRCFDPKPIHQRLSFVIGVVATFALVVLTVAMIL